MIFVTLGTFPTSFVRPLAVLHECCLNNKINTEIVVQCGYTEFESEFFEMRPFIQPNELDELTKNADLIITHAGTGSMIKAIKYGRKIIAIPRLGKYAEAVDDHQLEILEVFAEKGYVLPWHEDQNLEDLLNDVKSFVPNEYVSKKEVIIEYLENYINSL